MEFIQQLFGTGEFIPHGHCYLWSPGLLWTVVGSNLTIGLAYLGIAIGLTVLVNRLSEAPFRWMYYAFAVLFFTCGFTHLFDILVIWKPYYWADATLRVVTAGASIAVALLLPPLIPKAIGVVEGVRAAAKKGIRLESAVDDLESMYRKARELEEKKSQFFANVSHELRTPLTLLLGEARNLLNADLGEEQRERVQTIVDNSRVLLKHVEDLLGIASFEAGEMQLEEDVFDLVGLVGRAAGTFDGLAEDYDIDFRVETPEELPVLADERKIESILLNLLSNAFKFTPDGGKVVCKMDREGGGDSGQGEMVVLGVRDSGPGVPEGQREEIFERFAQIDEETADRFGGTGLGLVVVRNYVDLHDGTVEVDDAPEGGASFRVRLPIVAAGEVEDSGEAEISSGDETSEGSELESVHGREHDDAPDLVAGKVAASRAAPKPDTFPPTGEEATSLQQGERTTDETPLEPLLDSAERITQQLEKVAADQPPLPDPVLLVVEDSPEMNEYICRLLEEDFTTLSVYDGEQALEKLERHHVDVVVTDLMMPNMNGEEFIERAMQLEDLPILVVTAKADDRVRRDLLRKGANDFLPKPFAPRELRTRVSNLASIQRTRLLLQRELASKRDDIESLAQTLAIQRNELKNALDTARVAREHAERASQMKTEFLGMVSHELRTPLAALQMQFHLLRERFDAPVDERREILDRAKRGFDRLLGVIEGLLNRAAIESGQLEVDVESFALVDLLDEIIEENRRQADSVGLELELEIDGELEPLETDREVVRLIVVNLVRNALKFTEEGGVYVTARQVEAETFVEVRDTGSGIDIGDQSEIFKAFRQAEEGTDAQTPGVGVGLSVVRDMVRALGGTVHVDSDLGEGAVFTVEFPTRFEREEADGEEGGGDGGGEGEGAQSG